MNLQQLMQSGMAGWRGVTSGVTMGLHKYPAAGLMVLIDKVMADNPGLTLKEALQLVNEQQQADRRDNPLAAYGGEIAGSFAPAGLAGRAYQGVSNMVGRRGVLARAAPVAAATGAGAGTGAVAGFNEQQDLGDAGVGAAFGSLGTLGGAALQSGVNPLLRRASVSTNRSAKDLAEQSARDSFASIAERKARLETLVGGKLDEAVDAYAKKNKLRAEDVLRLAETDPAIAAALKRSTQQRVGKDAIIKRETDLLKTEERSYRGFLQSQEKTRDAVRVLNDNAVSDATALANTRGILRTTTDNLFGARSGGGATAGNIGLGTLGGAGIAYLTDQDPMLGALLGAGAGSALTPVLALKAGAAQRVAGSSRLPVLGSVAANTGRLSYNQFAPMLQQAAPQPVTPVVDTDPWEEGAPAPASSVSEKDPWE